MSKKVRMVKRNKLLTTIVIVMMLQWPSQGSLYINIELNAHNGAQLGGELKSILTDFDDPNFDGERV
ncbi:hypothetical protein [Marinobacter sp.]|uniref:hypothetical protein n=1 Tax=Marinobacter sp. TaxID=50741 RepID=UPI003BA8FDEA